MVKTEQPEPVDTSKQLPIAGQPIGEPQDGVETAVEKAIAQYGPAIALAVCVLVLVSAGIAFWIQRNRDFSGENWSSIALAAQAQDAKVLENTAESARDSKAGAVAILNAGVIELNDAMEKILKDKVKAKEEVASAIGKIQQAKDSQYADDLIRQQATYSLAFANESIGEFDKALTLYEELVAMKENQFTIMAKDGVLRCKNPETKEFYEAFTNWKPSDTSTAPGDISELFKDGKIQLSPPEELTLEGDKDEAPKVPDAEGNGNVDETKKDETTTESTTSEPATVEPALTPPADEPKTDEPKTDQPAAQSKGDGPGN